MKTVIVGSGFGGLSAALRLKAKGHDVVWIDFKGMLVQEQGLEDIMEKGTKS